MERLQKVIANSGITSRRKAEEMISAGRVKVNGLLVTTLGEKVSKKDIIEVDGKEISIEENVYFVLNKPSGYLSSVSDDKNRKVVVDLINTKKRIFPIGRLDYNTTGVLLLTNDGELTNQLIHPKHHVEKEYVATVTGIFTSKHRKLFSAGVDIGDYVTAPCQSKLVKMEKKINISIVNVIIKEGKYHQIKRMFEAVGLKVKKLKRVRFGNITDKGLKLGEYRLMKPHEIKVIRELSKN
ncbi:pseudouridine synthase [Mycoplasmatota bacterium zrk1]